MFHSTSARRERTYNGSAPVTKITFSRQGNKGSSVNSYTVKIPEEASKAAKIIKGDRLDILVDSVNGRAALVRVNEGGWKCGKYSGSLHLSFQYTEFTGGVAIIPEKKSSIVPRHEVTDMGIIFDMPDSMFIK